MVSQNQYYVAAMTTNDALAGINALASLVTLLLLYDMKIKLNTYLKLVILMTFVQFFYDLNLLFYTCAKSIEYGCEKSEIFVGTTTGTAGALFSNILISIVLYVVKSRKMLAFNIIPPIICICSLLSLVVGLCCLNMSGARFVVALAVYDYIRLVSIVYNASAILVVYHEVMRMRGKEHGPVKHPVQILANRMSLYPLVQVIARIGASWYQLSYNDTITNYNNVPNPTPTMTIAMFFAAVLTPMAGLGYFIVFMIMQRGAFRHLLYRLGITAVITKRTTVSNVNKILSSSGVDNYNRTFQQTEVSSAEHSHNSSNNNIHPISSNLTSTTALMATLNASSVGQLSAKNEADNRNIAFEDMDEEELTEEIQRISIYATTRELTDSNAGASSSDGSSSKLSFSFSAIVSPLVKSMSMSANGMDNSANMERSSDAKDCEQGPNSNGKTSGGNSEGNSATSRSNVSRVNGNINTNSGKYKFWSTNRATNAANTTNTASIGNNSLRSSANVSIISNNRSSAGRVSTSPRTNDTDNLDGNEDML